MKISILTGSDDFFEGPFSSGMIAQAIKKGLLDVDIVNLREFASDNYRSIDDYPFGGGGGMVLKCEPVFKALKQITSQNSSEVKPRIIYTTPQGVQLDQNKAKELSLADELIFICGRYKGIDERISQTWVTDEISIGDYVLSGGEIPVMVILDAITRLLPEVLNNFDSAQTDSFEDGLLDCSFYTRPAEYQGQKVPEVLLGGDHKKIEAFRLQDKLNRTKEKRPDLYEKYVNEE